jgi:hypothetical protein
MSKNNRPKMITVEGRYLEYHDKSKYNRAQHIMNQLLKANSKVYPKHPEH